MTTEDKALALVNEIEREWCEDELTPRIMRGLIIDEALCRAIEQHEAFRQEVSDALRDYYGGGYVPANSRFAQFILPAPKPDPLVEIIGELDDGAWGETKAEYAAKLRAALEARGFEIREKNDDYYE